MGPAGPPGHGGLGTRWPITLGQPDQHRYRFGGYPLAPKSARPGGTDLGQHGIEPFPIEHL